MRFLAVDYGDVRTGFAVSDELGIIARELSIEDTNDELFGKISSYIEELSIIKIIVGKPVAVSTGGDTEQTEKVYDFVEKLKEHIGIDIEYIDERFTSKIIHRDLRDEKRKPKNVDSMSACLILQSYLDKLDN